MTLHHPLDGALTRPTDYRHIPQTLDRITGISADSRLLRAGTTGVTVYPKVGLSQRCDNLAEGLLVDLLRQGRQ